MATFPRKSRPFLAAAAMAAVATIGLAGPSGQAQPSGSPSPAYEGILVLHNGNLLRGTITQTDGRYHVTVEGGLIHLNPGDVAFTCRTLEEAYAQKRALIEPGVVRDHLELAQWCQRYGLLEPAARELALAKALEPRHPLIPLIEQRITTLLRQPEGAASPTPSPELVPSPEELDRLVGSMPAGSVETFTQKIQPMLVNRCAAAGCHGPGSESRYRLLRPSWGKPANRRLTLRNLHSTLEWVDRNDPSASKLLTAPTEAHGSLGGAVFKDHEADQYQRIVEWVYQMARKDSPPNTLPGKTERPIANPFPSPSAVVPAVHTAPSAPVRDGVYQGAPGVTVPDLPLPSGGLDPGPTHFGPGATPIPSGFGMGHRPVASPLAPADPFDAEVFNRRYFPDRPGRQNASPLPVRPSDQSLPLPGPPGNDDSPPADPAAGPFPRA